MKKSIVLNNKEKLVLIKELMYLKLNCLQGIAYLYMNKLTVTQQLMKKNIYIFSSLPVVLCFDH